MTAANSNLKVKDPNAILDYRIDWGTNWLGASETITTSTWVVDSGITQDRATNTTTTATIWLSGGTHGTKYTVTNRIVTNQGRTNDSSLIITVQNM